MTINCIPTTLPGVVVIEPQVHGDHRGFFLETYHVHKYREFGIEKEFVQDNVSHSSHGILRGLHYQLRHPQAKLISVLRGEIFDVAVDIRHGSPTFGRWESCLLSSENHKQLYVPEGFAHGFCVLSEEVDVMYKCTDIYYPEDEYGVFWSDSMIGVNWPIEEPILSKKDSVYPFLKEISKDYLPSYS